MIICPNLSNPLVAKEFNEIKDAIEAVKPGKGLVAAHLIWSLNNGNGIDKAPNGAESVLFNSLLEHYNGDRNKAIVAKAKTYSNNFLKWFGDWTGDNKKDVSKVVDENGEPKIVWHGSRISNNIEEFQNDNTFFADRYTAFSYTPFDVENELDYMYPVFLSIKNPKSIDGNGSFWNNINGLSTDDIIKTLHESDGAIISNLKDYSDFTPGNPELSSSILEEAPLHTDYITSSKDQIKHVDNRDEQYTGNNIYHNLSPVQEDEELKQISLIFDRFPELDEVGTPEQYYWYILSIFPNSKDKRIYWHGSDADFSDGLRSAKRLNGSGAPETKNRNDFYLARQAWTVLLYVSGVNRKNVDKNGFSIWNKLWFEFKEIMANGRRENNDWKNIVINENTVRQAIPNKKGVFDRDSGGEHGKWLKERKADYGYENKSDKEFFEEILGVNWGEDTFNTWTRRNAMIFKQLLKNGEKGIYPVIIDVKNPIREVGQDTYYEEHRGLMTKADKEGYDTILSEKSDNEFNSDIAVVINVSENRVHFLGSKDDIKQFEDFVREHPYTEDRAEQEPHEVFSPFPEYDEETKQMLERLSILQKEFNDLKDRRIELNKKLKETKSDTISKKIITLGDGKIKFIEKPNHLLRIDNDQRIFTLVSTCILFDGNVVTSPLLFPSRNVINPAYNYYRIDNSIRDNTNRLVYEMLSVLKDHGNTVVYSPWHIVTSGLFSEPDNAGKLKERMAKVLGIRLSDFVTHEETVVEDDTPLGKQKIRYYRMAFNIDTMLNRLDVLGHNKEIYDVINKTYEQKHISKSNDLLIKALLSEEMDIDERQSQIQKEMRDINENLYKKEQENSDLPFNITQGSLIWLVKKYINEGRSRLDLLYILDEINYTNGSKIKINWSNFDVYAEPLSGKDDIKRTVDNNIERINAIVKYLNEKFGNKLQVEYINEDTWLRDSRLYNGSNSCIIGDVIYLRKSRMTTEIAAEEMLHTFVHGMKCGSNELGNKELFDNLFEKAKQLFPKLWNEILSVYKYNHDEELVTQVLARYFNRDFDKRDSYKLEDLINKFKNWFIKLFKNIIEEFAGNYYATVGDINPILNFQDISDMLLAKNLKFDIQTIPEIHKESLNNKVGTIYTEEQILHNISSRQQAAQDESQRLIVRMNVLYRQYEKMKDKTPSQQKIADRIFETLNKLKQHRDIAAVGIALEQAKLSLGQYDETIGGPATMLTANIYDYLYKSSQNNFDGVTAKQLVDMYRNTIKFYSDLIEGIPSELVIDLSEEDKTNIKDIKNLIEDHIMPLWINAIMKVGDDLVDAAIDDEVEASDVDKEDMKKVAKDWLHKNMMYGDVNAVASYIYNYSYSSDPIIKQAFHLIQHAEQQTLEEVHHIAPNIMKAYQKANKGSRSWTPGWQSMFMEFDDENKPTGNFIRDINYGLYQKDLKLFIERLNQDFLNRYGFTYVTDDTGAVVNSLTNEFAEDEEWGPNGEMPKYVEYQLMIEHFKSPLNGPARVNRRFTGEYYRERLSRPYDGTIDPYSPEFKDTRFNHGLSPKTLTRYNYYQSNINYYLNKCQDPNNGLVYPEKLSKDDKTQLDRWTAKMDKFTNIFNDDGSYKSGEDLKMAFEVRAWRKWIGQHTDSIHLQRQFEHELNEAYQESVQKNNPSIYYDFLRFNASMGINPDYIEQTVGSLKSTREDGDLSLRGKLMKASLQDMVKSQLQYTRNLKEKENEPLFWLKCKSADLAIQDGKEEGAGGWSKDLVEAFQNNFYDRDILYVDDNNFYIDENGNTVDPNDPNAKILEEAGKLLTFRQYLINKYTNEALSTGSVSGLIDEATGALIDFTGMSQQDIRRAIVSLLSYKVTESYPDGSVVEKQYPLTIFQMTTPSKDTFFNNKTGKTEKTITYVGERRFRDSVSSFTNPNFNPNEGLAEKPNALYDSGRYDNSENFNKVISDDSVHDLYDLLIKTMEEMLSIYSTNRKFNYKLPMINARTAALFSRILKRGYSTKAIKAMWDSMTSIEENDEDMRTKLDYFIGVDGQMANDVPLKFIRNLKNMEDLSTDVVSSVILFADMAINYKNKSVIDSTLKLLRYNMDPDNREIYDNKLKPKSEPVSKSNKNSIKMYDSMMDTLMYGNKYGDKDSGGPGKVTVAVQKTADAFLSLESSAMLGLNMFSMAVGFADSITRIFSESVMGKYMTKDNCLWALGKCLWYTPQCIKNMFNPLANNKMTALMQMNGISKGTFGIYTKTDWGKGRKFITDLLMGGWSMLDWMANALLMMIQYHHIRFYDGGVVDTGFYSKYDLQQAFIKAGHTKSEANAAYNNWLKLGSRVTLWDAYEFAPYSTDENGNVIKLYGQVRVKPEYEQYVTLKIKTRIATKTKKRGGLYNGMNPDNDIPRWKRDVIGRLAGALRGWIVQQLQHLIAGGTDNIARDFYTELKYETTPSGTRATPRYKKKKLTDELKSRRMAWDYETGTPQDLILVALYRSIKTMLKMANQTLMFKPKTAKLSEVEKYAWKDAIIFIGMLAMMMVGWIYVHDDARTVQPPKNREEAGPASMWNPVDYYEYMRDVYIPNQYWKLGVDDIYFRTVEAKISNVNPQLVLDIWSAVTALKSGLDDLLGIIGMGADLVNGENNDEVLKLGAYKFYTKGDRILYRAIGPAKNLHTALTYYGATNNLRWYTNKFGKLYRAIGYDFKLKDKDAERAKMSSFSGGDFSGGDFSGGDFSGGDFSGGNFE